MVSSVENQSVLSGQEVVVDIVETVAAAEGVDATDLEPPLYEVIDPDAITALFSPPNAEGHLTFLYRGHEVAVDADGQVTLTE